MTAEGDGVQTELVEQLKITGICGVEGKSGGGLTEGGLCDDDAWLVRGVAVEEAGILTTVEMTVTLVMSPVEIVFVRTLVRTPGLLAAEPVV